MAKLKLKSVQNGVRGDNVNLMSIGDLYFDESGNWVDNSGNLILDESGNTINGGYIQIDGGTSEFIVSGGSWAGDIVGFTVKATWESGYVNLPYNDAGGNPIVPIQFEVLNCIDYTHINWYTLQVQWASSTIAYLTIRYGVSDLTHYVSGIAYGLFSIPYSIIPPSINGSD